ncbi:expressed unknown protein [Seminavis robusta]|uniref:Uncharacterized protein n=1 Tax=Seminavis robusta TaxID=568900 RepID=A0A9N8E272_9STRA|nr:expressed unknown protein [Seminavis robusta]|eukprot:Sro574_g169090.1 n/a (217) ;mRNA; f:2909-3559
MSTGNNPSLWNDVKAAAKVAGKKANVAAQKAKIHAELVIVKNKIKTRKHQFGIELYDFLVPFAEKDPSFIIESDTLTHIQGLFVTAFKDNKALLQKKAAKEQDLNRAYEKRAMAFPVPAETISEKVVNAGKSAKMAGNETALKTKMNMYEMEMNENKKNFGVQAYGLLVQLEDNSKWLPTDRDVRFFYDQARREIMQMEQERANKEADLGVLGLQV